MSRVANNPVALPKGVEVKIDGRHVAVKGAKGTAELSLNARVNVQHEGAEVRLTPVTEDKKSVAMAGTMRALVNNMVVGVSEGFERQLELRGVGYRAQAQGKTVNLTLGFSHPINYAVPDGVEVETPSQTQIVVRGVDKQKVGQVAAEIRAYRPPEPYKGKGVRYTDERVVMKEAKKK